MISRWPMWLQLLVMVPHAVLATVLLWIWWPKTPRDWLRWFACGAYFVLFYLILVR